MKARWMLLALIVWAAPAAAGPTWYEGSDVEKAMKGARILGKPLAFLVHLENSSCPLHNAQRSRWKNLDYLEHFVCIMVAAKGKAPDPLPSLRRAAAGKAGKYVPRLYLGSLDGEFLGVVRYNTPNADTVEQLRAARKKYGPVPGRATAVRMWNDLKDARALWEENQIGPAMLKYQKVLAKARLNENLPVFKELKKDRDGINAKGRELIAKAKKMAEDG
ncbi:MAG: hypothetical protein R6V58_13310, partial [Planctomycetota bacterium]